MENRYSLSSATFFASLSPVFIGWQLSMFTINHHRRRDPLGGWFAPPIGAMSWLFALPPGYPRCGGKA